LTKATPIGAGKSSFELIDSVVFFRELDLKPGMTVLDLACGKGAYSLAASEKVGPKGTVLSDYHFKKRKITTIGAYNYLMLFEIQ